LLPFRTMFTHTPIPPDRPAETPETLFYEGVALMTAGSAPQAEQCFRRACDLKPEFGEAHLNLGLLLEQRGLPDEAEKSYRQALRYGASHPEVYLNLGGLALAQEQLDKAREIFTRGLHTHPESAALWSNMGVLYACEKKEAQAESCYRTALRQAPGNTHARFNLAYVLLRQGRYVEGFEYLEARDWYAGFRRVLSDEMGVPRWQGEALSGRSVLITCEAGHGDMIQFCRYASNLKAAGATRVDILCHPGLRRLLESLADADEIHALGEETGDKTWDFWCPALTLPHFCGTTLENLPNAIPYLHATVEDKARWLPRLPAGRPRIGLVWHGNRNFENDRHRSLPHVSSLLPLWSVTGAHFVSLQKGSGEDELASLPDTCPLIALGADLQDFADTAGVLANLDLLITVDTGVAHLAGAMGIPCWVLLPDYKTDWRWLTNREDSPWYPQNLRLFRQPAPNRWSEVISQVAGELEKCVRNSGATGI
jgi:tetratricopeptide (TPR) repeat protein